MYPFEDFSPIVVRKTKKGRFYLRGIEDQLLDKKQLIILIAGLQNLCLPEVNPDEIALMFTLLTVRGHNEAYFSAAGEFQDTGRYNE